MIDVPLIGLCGYAQSGKDTAADGLVAHLGWTRAAFADALKTMGRILWPTLDAKVENLGWEAAKKEPAVREYLQTLGVAARTAIGPDVWVNAVAGRLRGPMLHPSSKGFVITDVRFPNEAEWIKNQGGILVRIIRPSVPTPVNDHISETAWLGLEDVTVYNDGPAEHLWVKVLTEAELTHLVS